MHLPNRPQINRWFERTKLIRFQHCDPAAIIFYPQYFVLFHELQEDWFTEGLDENYGDYIFRQRLGVPSVKASCEFLAQSRLGDEVLFRLHPTVLGKSSLTFTAEAACKGELRARGEFTVVQMSLDTRKAVPFRGGLRARIESFMQD